MSSTETGIDGYDEWKGATPPEYERDEGALSKERCPTCGHHVRADQESAMVAAGRCTPCELLGHPPAAKPKRTPHERCRGLGCFFCRWSGNAAVSR